MWTTSSLWYHACSEVQIAGVSNFHGPFRRNRQHVKIFHVKSRPRQESWYQTVSQTPDVNIDPPSLGSFIMSKRVGSVHSVLIKKPSQLQILRYDDWVTCVTDVRFHLDVYLEIYNMEFVSWKLKKSADRYSPALMCTAKSQQSVDNIQAAVIN